MSSIIVGQGANHYGFPADGDRPSEVVKGRAVTGGELGFFDPIFPIQSEDINGP